MAAAAQAPEPAQPAQNNTHSLSLQIASFKRELEALQPYGGVSSKFANFSAKVKAMLKNDSIHKSLLLQDGEIGALSEAQKIRHDLADKNVLNVLLSGTIAQKDPLKSLLFAKKTCDLSGNKVFQPQDAMRILKSFQISTEKDSTHALQDAQLKLKVYEYDVDRTLPDHILYLFATPITYY